MYLEHFGLQDLPFSIAVNPRFLFMSPKHKEALAHLLYGIQNGGFVMLTGEVGTGKTTIVRCVLEQLPVNTDVAFILNPMANAPELLCTICEELGVEYDPQDTSIKTLMTKLQAFLLANHARGRRTILLIDEAQLLRVPVLEQIRLLTNLETTTQKLLQIILVGQPELKTMLARPALRQLSQRITARFHLEALTLEETHAYIAHRLVIAGMPAHVKPFSEKTLRKIHLFSGGVPRLINILSDRLLLGAYAANTHQITDSIYKEAITEVAGNAQVLPAKPLVPKIPLIAAASALIVLGVGYWLWSPMDISAAQSSPVVAETQLSSSTASDGEGSSSSAALVVTDPVAHLPATASSLLGRLLSLQTTFDGATPLECVGQQARLVDDWVCEKVKLSSWNEISELNRPLILTLIDDEKRYRYALVDGLGQDRIRVQLDVGVQEFKWRDVISRWNGEALYVWRKPAVIHGPLQPGDKGAGVIWLAETFAELDQQSAPLTRQYYTEKLRRRVEIFQLSQGLFADGIFGAQTLRKLNEVLGYEKTLDNVDASNAHSAVGAN